MTAGLGATGNFVPLPETEPDRPEIVFERSLKARNYRLTLRRDGVAVATIPARGSQREAERFVAQQGEWLERARARQRRRPRAADVWSLGARVLWRGELIEVRGFGRASKRCVRHGVRPSTGSSATGLSSGCNRAGFGVGRIEPNARRRAQRQSINSTSKISVAFGGIFGGRPFSP